MFTEGMVTVVNALTLVPMGLFSLLGVAAFFKLLASLLRREPGQISERNFAVEDA